MKTFLLAILIFYLAGIIISDIRATRKLKGSRISESLRLGFYRASILTSWVAACCMFIVAVFAGFTPAALGIRLPDIEAFKAHLIFSIIVIAVGAAMFIIISIQCVSHIVSKEKRAAAWAQLAGEQDGVLKDFTVELLLPRSQKELRVYPFVAFTAGICEEFIMRGVVFALLGYFFTGISPFLLPVTSALLFGFAHIYQGGLGIVKTGAAGLLLGCVYLVAGSLFPAMLLHFAMDLPVEFIAPRTRDGGKQIELIT